ncbi:MAG: hypothetical protein H5T91_02535 [Synergistetes bacterium]|nr:hypothetical protein [Synergistota bacterium]
MPSFLQGAVSVVVRRIAKEIGAIPSREAVMKSVLPKLFPGYSVKELFFEEGHLRVVFEPIPPLVEKVVVSFSPERVPEELRPLYDAPYGELSKIISSLFEGLPSSSLDWVQEIASVEANKGISKLLPGYEGRLSLFLLPGGLMVRVSLRGKEPIILVVDFALRSRTVPNIVLRGLREEFLPAVKLMEGLPVEFVRHHERFFKDLVVKKASSSQALSFYRVDLSPELHLDRISTMTVTLESRVWSIIAEGIVPVGLKDAEPEGLLHFGKVFKEGELFLEFKALLESLDVKSFAGLELKVGPKMWIGYKRGLSDGEDFFFLRYSNLQVGYWEEDEGLELSYSYWFGSWIRLEFTYSTHEEKRLFIRVVGRL